MYGDHMNRVLSESNLQQSLAAAHVGPPRKRTVSALETSKTKGSSSPATCGAPRSCASEAQTWRRVRLHSNQIELLSPNFPEKLSATYIVNAPAVFSWLYGMVKGFLNPGTAAKVQVFGASDDHLKALLEVMPLSTIPTDLGGEAPLPKNVSVGGTVPKGALADLRPTETWGAYDTRVAGSEREK